jgi:flagellar M-ring protein FliF
LKENPLPEQFEKFLGDLKDILGRLLSFLSPQQKRLLFIGLPVFGSLAYAAFFTFDRMNYGPLFTNLAPQDGAAIVKELEAAKIPYALSGGGSVIEIPRGQIYQTRLKLAGKGMPAGGGVGFEIFEKSSFGVSEFTQQVNYLRALQGELARTINSIAAVQSSRIHLAIPSRSNFLGPEEKPSASVVLELRPGYHLSGDQVQGIVNLVAGSVPKLSADKVTVIDSSGRPLKDMALASGGSEAEKFNALKIKYEQEMERRVETILEPVLGPGKAVVRANVLLNLQETQVTREEFDPENKVVRSQRQVLDEGPGKLGGVPGVQSNIPGGDATKTAVQVQAGPKRGSEMVTYEIGHSLSKIAEPRGQIQKISVAVLVDGKYEKDKYVPRSAEEIEVIKGVVKRAVGFDGERGDEIEIANVPFKVQPGTPLQPTAAPNVTDQLMSPLGIGIAAGALLGVGALVFFLTRGKKKETAVEKPDAVVHAVKLAVAAAEAADATPVAPEKIVLTDDPRKEQLGQIARDYHDATVRIIRLWLQEDALRVRAPQNGPGTEGLN